MAKKDTCIIDLFWSNVDSEIKSKKITQKVFCKSLKISPKTFSGWKTSKRLPDAVDACDIAKALDTTVEYLVTGTSSNPYKKKYDELVDGVKKLLP